MATDLVIRQLRDAFVGPIDLTVPGAACVLVSGPSGAGKSRLLRMIADLDPSDGDVRLGDRSRALTPAPLWRSQVVYVGAESGWWMANVADHFTAEALAAAEPLATQLGIADLATRPVASLSTGERQRWSLVRALARQPRALLLDEPTSSLDAASIARVEALLRAQTARGMALLVVSHDPGQAERLGARPFVMTNGRLAAA